jgi:hypothetical protein
MSTANPNRTQLNEGMELMSGSESDERTPEVGEPLYTLTGLSERDLETISCALGAYRDSKYPSDMDYQHVDTLRANIVDLWIMGT